MDGFGGKEEASGDAAVEEVGELRRSEAGHWG